jgi:hypothetical protein
MRKTYLLIFVVFLLAACGSRVSHMVVPDYAKKAIRLVVLMPVENRTNDQTAARMLREKMVNELYFKGYPKIPLDVIDAKLLKISQGGTSATGGNISPQTIGALLAVDAVMYCTLNESKASLHFFYAPTSVSASCALRNAKTGETLWNARSDIVERNYGYSRYDVERKASQVYESSIQGVINKMMGTLPDGPDLSG